MRFFTLLAAIAVPVWGAVCKSRVHDDAHVLLPASGITGRHIIKFKSPAAKAHMLLSLNAYVQTSVTHDWDIIPGIAGYFDTATLNAFRNSPDVEYIEQDGIARIQMISSPDQFVISPPEAEMVVESDAPWGLGRLTSPVKLGEQSDRSLSFQYSYSPSAGSGVDVYVVDTGVYTRHEEFGSRAKWGTTFGNYSSNDGNGHGTHCAGTIAGNQFGVAKLANVIGVKVLHDGGWGAWADVISGLNWVGQQAAQTQRPSIASMSLGGYNFNPVDDAVNALAASGVHVVVAAGNNGMDAKDFSPARAAGAISVGAIGINDDRVWFSNFGPSVTVFAPGVNVISAWICGSTSTNKISGTSMATPHVAGLVAYLIGRDGNVSPAAMKKKLQELAVKDVLGNIPDGTVNLLAHP